MKLYVNRYNIIIKSDIICFSVYLMKSREDKIDFRFMNWSEKI